MIKALLLNTADGPRMVMVKSIADVDTAADGTCVIHQVKGTDVPVNMTPQQLADAINRIPSWPGSR
jgi:hypothetical protein